MRVGEICLQKSIKKYSGERDGIIWESFSAERGKFFVTALIGVVDEGTKFDHVAALEAMGWTRTPERKTRKAKA